MTDLTLLGLGDMGAALARTWLAAGRSLTVWNRTPARAEPFGDAAVATAAEAVAASRLIVVCLLDDASVGAALADVDLTGKDVVNLTTSTPAQARARAEWARERGARFLDGGIMAVPPMIGGPEAYIFYSGSRELFDLHADVLAVPAGTKYVGEDPGYAALHDVALLCAMNGMFGGVAHAFALIRNEDIAPTAFAPLLADWLKAMADVAHLHADQLESGDYRKGVVSNLAMQVAGIPTLLDTTKDQGVSPELLTPYLSLMRRRLSEGHGDEDTVGIVDLLTQPKVPA
ncbi:NAD(P)-dependent oxidoreductase [Actinokineospora fastidiosa]|uniref:Dehydrogenase n=1 Tax=Actinokineospora fastidiosa TaxID=1816 RepID=A0A918GJF3_9PSEU|nr:NAD(P)-binding domain-containing protein [Actinokineospora fastidiosa]GGS41222.1 dehydrogenase [Actinokineospora fastidiosa]